MVKARQDHRAMVKARQGWGWAPGSRAHLIEFADWLAPRVDISHDLLSDVATGVVPLIIQPEGGLAVEKGRRERAVSTDGTQRERAWQ